MLDQWFSPLAPRPLFCASWQVFVHAVAAALPKRPSGNCPIYGAVDADLDEARRGIRNVDWAQGLPVSLRSIIAVPGCAGPEPQGAHGAPRRLVFFAGVNARVRGVDRSELR
jgi:hypothetical protein